MDTTVADAVDAGLSPLCDLPDGDGGPEFVHDVLFDPTQDSYSTSAAFRGHRLGVRRWRRVGSSALGAGTVSFATAAWTD